MLVRNRVTGQLHEVPEHLLYGDVDGYGWAFLAPLLPAAKALLPKVAQFIPKLATIASSLIPGVTSPPAPVPVQATGTVSVTAPPPPMTQAPPPIAPPSPAQAPPMTATPQQWQATEPPPIPVRTPEGQVMMMRPVRRWRRRRMMMPMQATQPTQAMPPAPSQMSGYRYGYGHRGYSGYGW
jgi:hypothetical protein